MHEMCGWFVDGIMVGNGQEWVMGVEGRGQRWVNQRQMGRGGGHRR